MDSVNFVHDVNVMRKNLQSVFSTSADLKALNGESGDGLGNCRIQVLPVCWRHLLDFPKRREEKRREHDLGEAVKEEYECNTHRSPPLPPCPILTVIRSFVGRYLDRGRGLCEVPHL